ncbi:MAG: sigma-70 family RNA polymerase sigma factor [Oscillospiraceae bacterium]|nr:sigma-70 family RNA polymerase sigma factor [Oscillospiraceae bacterium]
MNEPDRNLALIARVHAGDEAAFSALLSENEGLIWSIARRFFGRGVEPDDLYQLGCVGFVKAVRGFDPAFGTRFSTYAVPKITGEIRRFLRDDGPVKVSRTTKELQAKICAARAQLEGKLGREVRLSELAEATGLAPEEISACDLAASPVQSLQQTVGDDGPSLENAVGDAGIEDAIAERSALRKALEELPEKEKKVILLRFFRGLTQQQAAVILGISQVQVSRIERRAVVTLREKIL